MPTPVETKAAKLLSPKKALLTYPIDNKFIDAVEAMPGFRKWVGRDLLFEPTATNIEYLRRELPDVVWAPEFKTVLDGIARSAKEAERVRKAKEKNALKGTVGFEFKTKPRAHQRKAFLLQRDAEYFGLFMEQGTGKTKVIIDTVAYLWERGKVDTLLVLAPNGVHTNWILDEIPKHMPDRIPHVMAYYRSQPLKAEREQILEVYQARNCLRILAMNVEALSHARQAEEALQFVRSGKTMVVVDESSRIRTPGAVRTRNVLKLRAASKYRRILTGTPVPKGAEGLFSQLNFLHENVLGLSSFWTFKAKYCVMGGWENKQIVGYRNIDDLQKRVDGCSYRVLKSECLDLPPKVFRTRHVELTPKQRALYDTLAEEYIAEFAGTTLTTPLAITRRLRLQQIAGNWLPDAEGKLLRVDDRNPRLDALEDECSDAHEREESVIVWARFTVELDEICEMLRDRFGATNVVRYDGSVKAADREYARTAFQSRKAKFFVGQTQAAGLGLTLTAASQMIYYSQDEDLEKRLQSEDRAHRDGLQHSLTITDLSARRTVDQAIVRAHQKRLNFAQTFLRDPVTALRGDE